MAVTDKQIRKLMMEYQKTGKVGIASLRAGITRKTGRKYLRAGKVPSQMKVEHTWRTKQDPFKEHWEEAKTMLEGAPELQAKALFEWLCERHPTTYHEGQLRTFQRRIRAWRALEGPAKEVFFPQEHTPGRVLQTDFTWMTKLKITINREPFPHQVCHSVLPYSNWEWGVLSHSESMLALRKGLQAALLRLGHVPQEHWTDHSTAATHAIGKGKKEGWKYNRKYLDLMGHFGIRPRTIQKASPHENGDVESSHGCFKRRMEQHLLLRGSRDFGRVEEYVRFFEGVMEKANRPRRKRLAEELEAMRVLDVALLPEYEQEEVRVTSWSTICVASCSYSVPSRLIGEKVRVRCYEERLEVYYHGVHQLTTPRLIGKGNHRINYRHVIRWLIRKPGAFRRYRYKSDLFPTGLFRWAYDQLCEHCSERLADLEYLRILYHAAQTMECRVQRALEQLQRRGLVPRWTAVQELAPGPRPEVPAMRALVVDLAAYDRLLKPEEVCA